MKYFSKTIRFGVVATVLISAVGISRAQVVAVTAGDFTKVGLSGGQFLKIGVGARGTAMAGAYAAVANDLSSVYWNPAGLVDIKAYGAEFSHTFWFAGMSHSFAAAAIPVGEKFRLAASFTNFSSGDITITTTDDPTGSKGGLYSVNDVAVGVTLAGYLTEQFSFGVTGRYVSNAFSAMNASGFVFDIGTRYNTGFNGVKLGFGINSLGTPQAYDGPNVTRTLDPTPGIKQSPIDMQIQTSSFNMPLSFRAGIGVDMFEGLIADKRPVDDDGTIAHQWLVAADFETFADVPEQFAIGTEYTFREFISLRAGYRMGSDQFGLSGGIGINYISGDFTGRVDYSVSPTQNLGLVNRLSVSVTFD
ncbi:MAG: PorV/PorQ family protein [Bradyrhizobiaceae bacterium]|nr:PorV/PorQ family protein [Bradyrhizobiaceae bacterium]